MRSYACPSMQEDLTGDDTVSEEDLSSLLKEFFGDMEFEIVGEEIDGDTAKVEVDGNFPSDPDTSGVETINVQQIDGKWLVCDETF